MEKQDTIRSEGPVPYQSQRRSHRRWPKWIMVIVLTVSLWAFNPIQRHQLSPWAISESAEETTKPFDWEDVAAKPHLEYQPCYDGYECARLKLPMDYWNGTTNATIGLAVIKKPAIVPVTHPQYGGPILFNPGGPGGSGIGFLLRYAKHAREILEGHDSEGKYFDLMSFDPRGVENSSPVAQCSEDLVAGESWTLRALEEGVFSSSDAAFGRIWSMTKARAGSCSLPSTKGGPEVKKYVSTASVARDMLEIVERHGEWRGHEAKKLLNQGSCTRFAKASHSRVDVPKDLIYKPGKENINYLGFSYGSYLGNTFAAMFPDRINRLAVDGVVDAYDYAKSLWFDNLVDTEKDMGLLYYHCARVGYPRCALANETGPTTEEGVKQRVKNIVASLYHDPLPAIVAPYPEVISYSDVKGLILNSLYSPIQLFPLVAKLLSDVERGDGSLFAQIIRPFHTFDCSTCDSQHGRRNPERGSTGSMFYDASMAIACGDGDEQTWMTKMDFREHIDNITALSPTVGEIWANLRLRCIHYKVRPFHRFEGPWVGNTSFPILEIGNTADPVTSGRYAKKMAKGFPGAGVLIQDSAGHCSLSTPSKCTEAYIRNYFQNGKLPEAGTMCPADEMPFGPDPGQSDILDIEALSRRERANDFANALYGAGGGMNNANTARPRLELPQCS